MTKRLFILIVAAAVWKPIPTKAQSGEHAYFDADDGVRIAYRAIGAGDSTIIIVHGQVPGYVTDSYVRTFQPLASGHQVVFYDQRGNGKSTWVTEESRLTAEWHVADLDALRRHLNRDRVTLLGESWGAGLSALYAMQYPEHVERIVLVSAIPIRRDLANLNAVLRDRLGEKSFQRVREIQSLLPHSDNAVELCREQLNLRLRAYFYDRAEADRYAMEHCAGDATSVKSQYVRTQRVNSAEIRSLGEWDWRPRLSRITSPMLYIHPAFDLADFASGLEYVRSVKNGRMVVVDRAGHMVYRERPETFSSAS